MVTKVLLLGSGFVAKPTVDVLAADKDYQVTVACRTLDSAKALAGQRASATTVDVNNAESLDKAVAEHDLVISLIPYIFHAKVIESACRNKKNVVTTSYTSPAMLELEPKVKEAGIVVMNEIGLDPGIDHLYAVKTIDEVHKKGGKIISFLSYCGGLPAPEDSDNPLGYKFSWSSRGVLLALRNAAQFYKDGKVESIEGPELMNASRPYLIYPGFNTVAYPNRDSTPYKERYNIPEAQDIIRGTLRFDGFPPFIKVLVDLGFLDETENDVFKSAKPWNEVFAKVMGAKSASNEDLLAAVESKANFKNEESKQRILAGLRWLGLFSTTPITPRGNPLDTLCATLEQLMQFEKGERDLVILQHKFGIEWADGKKEVRTSTLVEYGAPTGSDGYSAMAKLVGVPCAVAVKQVTKKVGVFAKPGIYAPVTPEVAFPLLEQLDKEYGIRLIEKTRS